MLLWLLLRGYYLYHILHLHRHLHLRLRLRLFVVVAGQSSMVATKMMAATALSTAAEMTTVTAAGRNNTVVGMMMAHGATANAVVSLKLITAQKSQCSSSMHLGACIFFCVSCVCLCGPQCVHQYAFLFFHGV